MSHLLFGLRNLTGRNKGRIILRHRGGGLKNKYRLVDLSRGLTSYFSFSVIDLIYDPVRTTNIALILYATGIFSYILASSSMFRGQRFGYSSTSLINSGLLHFLYFIPRGSLISAISLNNFIKKAIFIRSAGTSGICLGSYSFNYILIKLPSKNYRLFKFDCVGVIGSNSNDLYRFNIRRKAGVNRLLNIRPTVRGVAMNPVDHPHGGGEGKSSGGRHPVSPWGHLTKDHVKTKINRRSHFILKL